MTVGELKSALEELPDDLPVFVDRGGSLASLSSIAQDKYWNRNQNNMVRVYAWQKDCAIIKIKNGK